MYQCRVDDGPANVPVLSGQKQVFDYDEKNVTVSSLSTSHFLNVSLIFLKSAQPSAQPS